ncbi:uncharacterized protein HD556DRAFT_1408128 [Suillus plorans]|uniref:Uncharacterized protein n=1 Tax=Suillus plorans TaxID=116603 RepID=A0A9P7AEG2_9AGAM|nr:uncharacterized protein HD556DRAFT_1408128 [Suillus plorans]KAG1787667.1 hypothetical protein HD556DRAFT_1408128 [Suillus plorans]
MPLLHIPLSPFSFLLIYRSAYVTPSYTLFTFLFLSHPSSSLCHSFLYPFHLSLSFSSIVQPMPLLPIPFSPFSFLLIYRPAYATPSYTPFTFHLSLSFRPAYVAPSSTLSTFLFPSPLHIPSSSFFPNSLFIFIVRPTSPLHIPFSPFSWPSDIYLFLNPQVHQPLLPSTSPFRASRFTSSSIPSLSTSCASSLPRGLTPIRAYYGIHATPYATYSIITTFSLPGYPFEARTTYTQLYTQPIPSSLVRL